MSTTTKIAHNTLIQIGGKVISTGLGLLAIGMMTRYLGQEQFGWYITVISFLGFAGILVDFGLIPVTAQMMSEPRFNKVALFKNLMGFRFCTACIFFGLIPFVALLFPYPREVHIAIGFVSLSFLAISMNQILVGFFQTKLKMHIQAIGEVVGRLVLIVGLWFVVHNQYGFLPVMGVVTLSSLAYTAVMWVRAHAYSHAGFSYDPNIWKAIVIKMWPITISIIFNVIYLKGDILILSLFRDQVDVGIYGAAYRVIDILSQLAMMLMGIMLPLMAYAWSRNDTKTFQERYQQSFDMMMLLSLPMAGGLIVTATPIMRFIGGDAFIASAAPLRLLAVAVFGLYLGAVFGHTAVAIDKQKQTMWIYISAAIITLSGYLFFIPTYGYWAAAGMTVLSELYTGVLLWYVTTRESGVRLRLRTVGTCVLSTGIMMVVLLLLPELHILYYIPIAAFAYLVTLFLLGGISPQTIRSVLALKQ